MRSRLRISGVRFTQAGERDLRTGVLGYFAFLIDGELRVDGVVLRQTRRGRPALSFPCRQDRSGRKHPTVCPIDRASRLRIERHLFRLIGIQSGGFP